MIVQDKKSQVGYQINKIAPIVKLMEKIGSKDNRTQKRIVLLKAELKALKVQMKGGIIK